MRWHNIVDVYKPGSQGSLPTRGVMEDTKYSYLERKTDNPLEFDTFFVSGTC